jgi:hypothetical protein
MKVHLFIQVCVLSSKHSDITLNLIAIERFHPMKSENILPNILSKKIYIAFERKIAQKKNIAN